MCFRLFRHAVAAAIVFAATSVIAAGDEGRQSECSSYRDSATGILTYLNEKGHYETLGSAIVLERRDIVVSALERHLSRTLLFSGRTGLPSTAHGIPRLELIFPGRPGGCAEPGFVILDMELIPKPLGEKVGSGAVVVARIDRPVRTGAVIRLPLRPRASSHRSRSELSQLNVAEERQAPQIRGLPRMICQHDGQEFRAAARELALYCRLGSARSRELLQVKAERYPSVIGILVEGRRPLVSLRPPSDEDFLITEWIRHAIAALDVNPGGHEPVRSLQIELARHKCDPGFIDGIWGKRTEAALNRFRQAAGASIEVDRATRLAISWLMSSKAPACKPDG